jgi:hypothetical protein
MQGKSFENLLLNSSLIYELYGETPLLLNKTAENSFNGNSKEVVLNGSPKSLIAFQVITYLISIEEQELINISSQKLIQAINKPTLPINYIKIDSEDDLLQHLQNSKYNWVIGCSIEAFRTTNFKGFGEAFRFNNAINFAISKVTDLKEATIKQALWKFFQEYIQKA